MSTVIVMYACVLRIYCRGSKILTLVVETSPGSLRALRPPTSTSKPVQTDAAGRTILRDRELDKLPHLFSTRKYRVVITNTRWQLIITTPTSKRPQTIRQIRYLSKWSSSVTSYHCRTGSTVLSHDPVP